MKDVRSLKIRPRVGAAAFAKGQIRNYPLVGVKVYQYLTVVHTLIGVNSMSAGTDIIITFNTLL